MWDFLAQPISATKRPYWAIQAGHAFPSCKARKNHNKPKWGEAERQLVLSLRRQNPTYGKDKIAIILKSDQNTVISPSTVGRILDELKRRGLIQLSRSAPKARRRRNFAKTHAKPWKFIDYNQVSIGQHIQIDHMTVTKNNVYAKHFQAWDPKSKFIFAQIFTNATSKSAAKFLTEFIQNAPFTIQSIQVDGGSEFMAEFEDACAKLNIPLSVLPPKRPDYNGGVERANRTFREEFYLAPSVLADSIQALRYDLRKHLDKYNAFRPHHSLNGLTPFQYIKNTLHEEAIESHIA